MQAVHTEAADAPANRYSAKEQRTMNMRASPARAGGAIPTETQAASPACSLPSFLALGWHSLAATLASACALSVTIALT